MISAVVINWNGRHYLEGCLDSLLAQRPAPDEIILVDNHSDDDSREFVGERYPDVRIVDTGYNAGPAYARNMGVAAARNDRVLLIDNDVTMETGALVRLNDTLDASAAAVIVQATPVGRHGERHDLAWPQHGYWYAFDMLYSPRQTPFLREAHAAKGRIIEGWEMLLAQAVESFELWTQTKAPLQVMREALIAQLPADSPSPH